MAHFCCGLASLVRHEITVIYAEPCISKSVELQVNWNEEWFVAGRMLVLYEMKPDDWNSRHFFNSNLKIFGIAV